MSERIEENGGATVVIRDRTLNQAGLWASYHALEAEINEQEAELPWEFYDDDSLQLYVEAPELLRSELYDAVEGFVNRYHAVDRRRELFFRRWQIEQAMEGVIVLTYVEPLGQA